MTLRTKDLMKIQSIKKKKKAQRSCSCTYGQMTKIFAFYINHKQCTYDSFHINF